MTGTTAADYPGKDKDVRMSLEEEVKRGSFMSLFRCIQIPLDVGVQTIPHIRLNSDQIIPEIESLLASLQGTFKVLQSNTPEL